MVKWICVGNACNRSFDTPRALTKHRTGLTGCQLYQCAQDAAFARRKMERENEVAARRARVIALVSAIGP